MEDNRSFDEFVKSVANVKKSRNHKVKGSYGIYDGYKFYRKIKPKEHKYVLTESQYFAITRRINELLGEGLVNGEDITFPCRMGRLEIRKYMARIAIEGDKIKTNLPVDWNTTLRLWYEDEESYNKRILIRVNEKEIYRTYYNKNIANYNNKSFYKFALNRELKRKLSHNIKEGKLDAFLI